MRIQITRLLAALVSLASVLHSSAQGTAFTYQGRLQTGANAANGSYDLAFTLYSKVTSGILIAGPATNAATTVSNGLFTVTLDFGSVFPGVERWLEIAVQTNGGAGFTVLTPRQALTATPYAIFAGGASNLLGTVSSANLSGFYSGQVNLSNPGNIFTGNGGGVTNVNAAQLNGLTSGNFWQLGGNNVSAGQFLGSTNNQAVEIKANGTRALRIEPNSSLAPNVIGGAAVNFVANGVVGATISGGGAGSLSGFPYPNSVAADFGAVGGGYQNQIATSARASTIGGGSGNQIGTNAQYASIGGGSANQMDGGLFNSTIGGGGNNWIRFGSDDSVIGGGVQNTLSGDYSAVVGGNHNTAFADYSTVGGGNLNTVSASNSVVGGGNQNNIDSGAGNSSLGGGNDNGIGLNAANATIGGGAHNNVGSSAAGSVIGGGENNLVSSSAADSVISGGSGNNAMGNYSTVPGGDQNTAAASGFAAGHRAKANHTGAFVWGDSTDADFASTAAKQFLIRAGGGVGINTSNPVVPLTVEGKGAYNSIGAAAVAVRNPTANKTWEWHVLDDGRMQFADLGAGASRMIIDTAGNISTFGNITNSGNVNATAFNTTSDRNAKEHFAAVSAQEILAKVVALPITQWNFKSENTVQHVGPMAQDFRAAFGLGPDEKHIATVDADGVALAAIQGLNQKVESGKRKAETQMAVLQNENADLKAQLTELKVLVQQLAGKK